MAMSPKTAARLAWSGFAVFALLAGAGLFLTARAGGSVGDDALIVPAVATFPLVGAIIASRRPQNPIGWLMIWAALGAAIGFSSSAYADFALPRGFGPRGLAVAFALLSQVIWLPSFGTIPTFLLLLFPTGRLPSPRWRVVAWSIAAVMALGVAATLVSPGPIELEKVRLGNPLTVRAIEPVANVAEALLFPLLIAGTVASFASLIVRYRRAEAEEREQLKLFTFAGATSVVAFSAGDLLPDILGEVAFWGGLLGISASIGVAILKYRLYAIEVVVRKALVYGILAAVVTGLYLLLVVAVPAALLHPTTTGQTVITIGTTVFLTLALLPLRRRATHLANRLVYGKRATPYEVLSEFAGRVGGSYGVEDVLPRMTRVLAEGTGAERAEVLLRSEGGLRPAAVSPADAKPSEARDLVVPVVHQGEDLGALAVTKPRGEPLTPAEETLVRDLAAQAGLVLRNVQLFEDLRASRRRLVEAQDAERRRLERDVHDGAQQQLVAMAVKLRLLEGLTEKDPARARSLAAQIKEEAGAAIETLRDLARGIYPPLLADEGLPAALAAQARRSAVAVEVHPDGVGRYPQEVEAAVYFCVLEALQNVAKYAEASRVVVSLSAAGDELRFEVVDDGRGFEIASASRGSGTQNMADRLEALGGRLEIRSAPGEGTTVVGTVPVESGR